MGKYYWCVKVRKELSNTGEILLHADEGLIFEGALMFKNSEGKLTFCFAKDQWTCFYAASCFDGHAICVEHWNKPDA